MTVTVVMIFYLSVAACLAIAGTIRLKVNDTWHVTQGGLNGPIRVIVAGLLWGPVAVATLIYFVLQIPEFIIGGLTDRVATVIKNNRKELK